MASYLEEFCQDLYTIQGICNSIVSNHKKNSPRKQTKTIVQVKEVLTADGKIVPLRTMTRTVVENEV